jgi:FtsK/SpoIIIE family
MSQTAGPRATADQLMRRMLNALSRLESAYNQDELELAKLRDKRTSDMANIENATRGQATRDIASADELKDPSSLGSRLRIKLDQYEGVQIKHVPAGAPPASLSAAIQEWNTLAPTTERHVRAFTAAHSEWSSKIFKRESSRPQVPGGLWEDLDRLDLIHRSIPSLTQGRVADRIREASAAVDVLIQAEQEKQRSSQRQFADGVNAAIRNVEASLGLAGAAWTDPQWASPVPAEEVQHLIRLGELRPGLPDALGVLPIPALTTFPFEAGLAVSADVADRDAATALLKSLVLRLFAAVPAGGLHVKAVDPVALGQSVAELRHLAEYDSQLMDEKTWTSERDIERLMDDLSDHLEVVISKYLRGQFETIDEYNQHAGEVAQPYRLLTVFDYPSGFSGKATKQLLSLIENGPRCGVYTVLHYDRGALKDERYQDIKVDRLIHSMQKITFGRTLGGGAMSSGSTPGSGATTSEARLQGTVIGSSPGAAVIELPNGERGYIQLADLQALNPSWGTHSLSVGQKLSVVVEQQGTGGRGHQLKPAFHQATTTRSSPTPTAAAPALRGALLELGAPVGEVKLDLLPDAAPPLVFDSNGNAETGFAKLLLRVGTYVREFHAKPPAVTLDTLLPVLSRTRTGVLPDFDPGAPVFSTDPHSWWHASTARNAVAPIGRAGAQGVTSMFFSSTEVAGGAIMVGLPRSGKTTSLHSMILGLSMLYSPEELELYLIDAKHGVEFKAYENLPHARMVSVHSEREFSLAVLKSIEKEIQHRAELMKRHGAGIANITEYRQVTGAKLPRIVVVIDEFHELFEEADNIGLTAFSAFSNIVRMGPFSGAHVVVASQTLSNMPAMDRPTLTLLPQRVAFMCNEYDSEIVMGESNKATRLLTKTGEGLFNPSRGEESKNQPFQGLYVPTDERTEILRRLSSRAAQMGWKRRPRVFDGDAVVDRPDLASILTPSSRFNVPVGEPFTLADTESIVLGRTRGANLLLVGDQDDEESTDRTARSVIHSILLAAQLQKVEVTVVDFLGEEENGDALTVMDVAEAAGARYVRSRSLGSVLQEFAETVNTRNQAEDYKAPTRLLILFGVQRAISLAPFESYEMNHENPTPTMVLAGILAAGPEVGVHVVLDADRSRSVEMRLGSELLGELTQRITGSAAEQKDLALVTGEYGGAPSVRYGQLLIGDQLKGTTKRVRGYRVVSEPPSGN